MHLKERNMLRDENIIVFSSADWRMSPTSPQHISENFAKENKVLFIETFGSRWPSLKPGHIKRIKSRFLNWFKGIKKVNVKQGSIYIYPPIALTINLKPFLFINKLIYSYILKRLIKKLNMKNPILYIYLPTLVNIIGGFREKAVVYHCIDEWSTYPGGENRTFMDSERKLIKNADLVLVANELLYEKKKLHARRIHKIYHGVDYTHFTKEFAKDLPLPEDIKNIPRPIIASIGAFTDWIDLDLIKLIAQRHKEWSIVSIGPIGSNVDIRSLISVGNIHILGQKNYSELPHYYRAVDVFIIPFLLNEHIKYCAPTRLYEHLSSGKPIIATDFPAVREVGKSLINITSDREDFIKKIEAALKEKDPSLIERSKALARRNTWESRVDEISNIIEKVMHK